MSGDGVPPQRRGKDGHCIPRGGRELALRSAARPSSIPLNVKPFGYRARAVCPLLCPRESVFRSLFSFRAHRFNARKANICGYWRLSAIACSGLQNRCTAAVLTRQNMQ